MLAFGMVLNEDGRWTWEPFWNENWSLVDKYNDLVKRWNRVVPILQGERARCRPSAGGPAPTKEQPRRGARQG
jgi:hypothetical protein